MKYNIKWAIEQTERGNAAFLLFWGHQPSKDGSITSACFSQWWVAPFVVQGETFLTAEHWMMAGKARLFGDEQIRDQILATPSPKDVKALGRKAQGFDAKKWDAEKYRLVLEGNRHKFEQNPPLGDYLCSTGDTIIVEASPFDRVWGIGMDANHPQARNPARWEGDNLLGFALMQLRGELTDKQA